MKTKLFIGLIIGVLISFNALAMSRTIKKEPAIVLAAFGTTTKARATFDFIDLQIKSEKTLKKIHREWAFTSEIIRERANKAFAKKGDSKRYLSLSQVLANLEAEGYRKIIIQPLHIFPGQEYEEVKLAARAFALLGLRIELGETLLHEWPYLHEVVDVLERDFLPQTKGCNIIVSHGTPQAFHGANSTYLGLDRYITGKYNHVFVGAVEGILTREQALFKAKKCQQKSIRFIPLMLVSGDHIMNDIMASEPEDGELSWALEMKRAGFKVDILQTKFNKVKLYDSLGLNKDIVKLYIRSIREALQRIESY